MNTENRRGFLKALITGGAGAVVGTVAKAAPPPLKTWPIQPIIIERTKIVKETEPFPQNISSDEMAMWLAITAKRRYKAILEKMRIDDGGSPWK